MAAGRQNVRWTHGLQAYVSML